MLFEQKPIKPVGGCLELGDDPGLGVIFDETRIEKREEL